MTMTDKTLPETGHTKTPWRFEQFATTSTVFGADGNIVCDDEAYYPAAVSVGDMRFIVLSCNSHERLTEAAKAFETFLADLTADLYSRNLERPEFLANLKGRVAHESSKLRSALTPTGNQS